MPPHVQRYLESIGRISADGVTRKAGVVFCRHAGCGVIVIRGLDHDKSAVAVSVDPVPLSALGEAEVLMAGRRTFELAGVGAHYRIDTRWSWHISGHPAGTTYGDVVAEHSCGIASPTAPRSILPTRIAPMSVTGATTWEPPF